MIIYEGIEYKFCILIEILIFKMFIYFIDCDWRIVYRRILGIGVVRLVVIWRVL